MQRSRAAEDRRRPVARIVVQERSAAGEHVLEVRQLAAARAGVDVILAADRKPDAIALWHDDRGRPDLDVELHQLTFLDWLLLVMGVIGPVWFRQFLIKLAV